MVWKKIFVKHKSKKNIYSKYTKNSQKLSARKITPWKHEHKIWTGSLLKLILRWPGHLWQEAPKDVRCPVSLGKRNYRRKTLTLPVFQRLSYHTDSSKCWQARRATGPPSLLLGVDAKWCGPVGMCAGGFPQSYRRSCSVIQDRVKFVFMWVDCKPTKCMHTCNRLIQNCRHEDALQVSDRLDPSV